MFFFFNIFLSENRYGIRSRPRWHHFKGTHSLFPAKFELQACFHFNTSCTTLYTYLYQCILGCRQLLFPWFPVRSRFMPSDSEKIPLKNENPPFGCPQKPACGKRQGYSINFFTVFRLLSKNIRWSHEELNIEFLIRERLFLITGFPWNCYIIWIISEARFHLFPVSNWNTLAIEVN